MTSSSSPARGYRVRNAACGGDEAWVRLYIFSLRWFKAASSCSSSQDGAVLSCAPAAFLIKALPNSWGRDEHKGGRGRGDAVQPWASRSLPCCLSLPSCKMGAVMPPRFVTCKHKGCTEVPIPGRSRSQQLNAYSLVGEEDRQKATPHQSLAAAWCYHQDGREPTEPRS